MDMQVRMGRVSVKQGTRPAPVIPPAGRERWNSLLNVDEDAQHVLVHLQALQ